MLQQMAAIRKTGCLRGALVAAGLDGVSSNGDLVQLTQLPARLCMPGRALVPADEAGAAGGAAGREAWSLDPG